MILHLFHLRLPLSPPILPKYCHCSVSFFTSMFFQTALLSFPSLSFILCLFLLFNFTIAHISSNVPSCPAYWLLILCQSSQWSNQALEHWENLLTTVDLEPIVQIQHVPRGDIYSAEQKKISKICFFETYCCMLIVMVWALAKGPKPWGNPLWHHPLVCEGLILKSSAMSIK